MKERLWSLHEMGEFIECEFLQLQEWVGECNQ